VFADGARPGYRELKDLQWLDCVVCVPCLCRYQYEVAG
jgi:hypothetical protein